MNTVLQIVPAENALQAQSLVIRLARSVHRALSGQLRPPGFVSPELAGLAERHAIGPMLFLAAEARTNRSDPQTLQILARQYDLNARRQCEAQLALLQMAQSMYRASAEWCVVGGWPEACLLYPDPNWRVASDIDILVAPGTIKSTARILRHTGWRTVRTSALPALLPGRTPSSLSLFGHESQRLNIHERLLSTDSAIGRVFDVEFRPRRSADAADIPSPRIGHALALAKLLHGANRGWSQLQWLIDLAALLSKMDADATTAMFEAIREAGVNRSAAASLLLYRTVLGNSIEPAVIQWLDEQCVTPKIEACLHLHLAALLDLRRANPRPVARAPLKTGRLHAVREAIHHVRLSAARALGR